MVLNLNPKHVKTLMQIFDSYCPNAEIWAYGSRVKNDCHEGSDLDLVVKNFNETNKNLGELKQLINDSNIPILVDIAEFDALPETFQKEILKYFVVLYKGKNFQ